jgi:hypothetical protein
MDLLIPFSFIGFDAVIYLISALIGFMVAYYAYKVYDITSNTSHFFLYIGFTILSMGLLVLSMASFYNFINLRVFCTESCYAGLFDQAFDIRDFGYWIYYASSAVAYLFFVLMYMPLPKAKKLPFFAILPFWYIIFPYFHLLSFFLIVFVIFRSLTSYLSNRSLNSLLITLAFTCMGIFHAMLFLNLFGKIIYVIAHFILLFGFASLLIVLIRINKAGKGKKWFRFR